MKKIKLLLLIASFLLLITPVLAGGSDAPIPYDLTQEGIQLPGNHTFPAHGHVNIRYVIKGSETEISAGVHFDPNNNQPGGVWIGKDSIPWSAFRLEEGACITWIQIHGYNQHFGEGGQDPFCIVVPEEPVPEVPEEPTPEPEVPEVSVPEVPEVSTPEVSTPETPVPTLPVTGSAVNWIGYAFAGVGLGMIGIGNKKRKEKK